MDSYLQYSVMFLSFNPGRAFLFFAICGFFLGGGRFWGRENSLLVAIIVHDRCSSQRVGTHL